MTKPARPRKVPAERYSPQIAAAFKRGLTLREATKKSEVVLEYRSESAPITDEAITTITIARIEITADDLGTIR
jgi:hypothetical protein